MTTWTDVDSIHCRVIAIDPRSRSLLALEVEGTYRLPRFWIPRRGRPAREICAGLKRTSGLSAVVLEFLSFDENAPACVIAQFIGSTLPDCFRAIRPDELEIYELSEQEHCRLKELLEDRVASPLSRIGWLEEAMSWVEQTTGRKLPPNSTVEQYNAGGAFALISFRAPDGGRYWLKATGYPNQHEYSVTLYLSELAPDGVPRLVGVRKEWNAWLTEDAGMTLGNDVPVILLSAATRTLADLQNRTIDCIDVLLRAGAFDQRMPVLTRHIDPIIEYLIEAMRRQTSTKSPPLTEGRLREMGAILRDACLCLEELRISNTLLHNDLNGDNMLWNGERCVITDWSEASVGNPFLCFERLCRLTEHPEELRIIYTECWLRYLDESAIQTAYKLAPLLSMYAYLYGRGRWLKDMSTVGPRFESYIRSLARHMDLAARNPVLLEALLR